MIDSRDPTEERRAAHVAAWCLVAVALVVVWLVACVDAKRLAAGAGINVGTGEVFACTSTDGTTWELCWPRGVAELVDTLDQECESWSCVPTPRHAGPCVYQCPSARGCNALDGCYCP